MQLRKSFVGPLIPYISVILFLYGTKNAWAALLGYHAGALLFMTLSNKPAKVKQSVNNLWIPPIAVIYSLGGIIFYFLWPYLDGQEIGHKLTHYGINAHSWPYIAVYFCFINAVVEEHLWRNYLGSDNLLPTLNDFLFAGYHALVLLAFTKAIWAIPVIVACAFAGWLWRVIKLKSGGMLIPIITHIIADVSIAAAVHFRLFH
jgi:membrane protease YdiL (CAAX protease family)